MVSTSCVSNSPFPMKEAAPISHSYPVPLAKYEEVVANPKLFIFTLEKLHASMGTKFMIPIIGGKELDLCRLFIEVTSRGGFEKLIKERRWKEVTSVFNFPSTATNASFVLRKYYASLLYHYEQIYFFKANRWIPPTSGALQSHAAPPVPARTTQFLQPSPAIQPVVFHQSSANAAEFSKGSSVVGVIDGKFESGYLVSVSLGSDMVKGVLYESPQTPMLPASASHHQSIIAKNNNTPAVLGVQRRRRRKKSEIKRRDPAHPKPNRSGYNFFFAEQHARLKLLNQAKDRDISRMIGELWNKLKEPERSVYQEKAIKDKERYQAEMEGYRERLKMGNVISDAVPLQQRLPESDASLVDVDIKLIGSPQTPVESTSSGSDYEDDDINMGATSPEVEVGVEATYVGSDKPSQDYELLPQCQREGDAGVQDVQTMNESKTMLALI
ncbi:high mobility group B protein 15-like [Lotus japonicus]|uniref:high mobility group B protein 15-like n=1 Tax=Lotus japonicus TaxID=34305 RepID=UPI0025911E97|nr:high mobility group B protein 15-like [Lotus japonicus]XP_057436622.1 high mobility group B protein 15-like [Lotus japonicus]